MSNPRIEGVDIHVQGEGAETIVMMHGWPDTWRLWDGPVAALAARYRCVRFTQPGFDARMPARSPSLDEMMRIYAAIVDHVSPRAPVTLMLHDWGCVFGLQYAMRHPDRVARIVAVDIGDTNSKAFLQSLAPKAKLGIAGYQLWLALAWKLRGRVGTAMTRRMAGWLRCPSDAQEISWQMNHPYWLTWTGGLRDSLRVAPACPVLYLYGERKPFMFHSPQWLERVRATPGGAVHGLRARHWVMKDAPAEFNAAVLAWLETTAPAARTAPPPAPASPPLSPATA
jgi:pimeloyl-ACP methyl ester carboxylesterase